MARIPRHLLKLLDETLEEDERVLWQNRPDSWASLRMTSVTWWLGVPWLAMTVFATHKGWISDATSPLLIIGAVIMAIPLVHFVQDLGTLYVITDQRVLIIRNSWIGKKGSSVDSTSYASMDKNLEILPVSGNVGHLNFASGVSTRNPHADHTGRYGFRCVKNVDKVRDMLAGAIARYA